MEFAQINGLQKPPRGFGSTVVMACRNVQWMAGGTRQPLHAGLTRIEIVVILAALSVIGAVSSAFLVRSKHQRQDERCRSNLKEIALGFALWVADNDVSRMPWGVPVRDKGNRDFEPSDLRQNSWFQFGCLSNQLRSPAVLADPADKRPQLRYATEWNANPDSGFFHPSFRNNACSYALLLDANLFSRKLPFDQHVNQPLALDRHFSDSGKRGNCTYGFRQVPSYPPGMPIQWTKEVHGQRFGNLSYGDGSVAGITTPELNRIVPIGWDWIDESAHYLFPNANEQTRFDR